MAQSRVYQAQAPAPSRPGTSRPPSSAGSSSYGAAQSGGGGRRAARPEQPVPEAPAAPSSRPASRSRSEGRLPPPPPAPSGGYAAEGDRRRAEPGQRVRQPEGAPRRSAERPPVRREAEESPVEQTQKGLRPLSGRYPQGKYDDPLGGGDSSGWPSADATAVAPIVRAATPPPPAPPAAPPAAPPVPPAAPVAPAAPAAPGQLPGVPAASSRQQVPPPDPAAYDARRAPAEDPREAGHDGYEQPRRSRRAAPREPEVAAAAAELADPYAGYESGAYAEGYDDASAGYAGYEGYEGYEAGYDGYDDYENYPEYDDYDDYDDFGPADRHGYRERPRLSVWKVLASTLIVLALIVGLFAAYTYRTTVGQIHGDHSADGVLKAPTDDHQPLNILVLASDTRNCKGCNVDGLKGTTDNSDTTILLHLSGDRKFAYAVSIPRDIRLDRPGCKSTTGKTVPAATDQHWNWAYSAGGQACTITQLTDASAQMCPKCKVDVNHFVVFDFSSFKGMVDAVDGVQVCLTTALHDSRTGAKFKAGKQTLSGTQALNYVRMRHSYDSSGNLVGGGGDTSRIVRQQAFIGSLMAKVMSNGTLANPTKVLGFLNKALGGLTMDDNLKGSFGTMASIASSFKNVGMDNIKFITLPVLDDPENPNATLVFDKDKDIPIFKAIAADEPLGAKAAAGAMSVSETPAGRHAAKKATKRGASKSAAKPSSTAPSTGSDATAPASSGPSQAELDQAAKGARNIQKYNGLCTADG